MWLLVREKHNKKEGITSIFFIKNNSNNIKGITQGKYLFKKYWYLKPLLTLFFLDYLMKVLYALIMETNIL